jgi:hypothetical protein
LQVLEPLRRWLEIVFLFSSCLSGGLLTSHIPSSARQGRIDPETNNPTQAIRRTERLLMENDYAMSGARPRTLRDLVLSYSRSLRNKLEALCKPVAISGIIPLRT